MYIMLRSWPTHRNYITLCHENTEGENHRNVIYISATSDLHKYFLCNSAIKFTFLIKTTTMHQQAQLTHAEKKRQQRQRVRQGEGEYARGGESIGGRGKGV